MPWFPVDDSFYSHPKALATSLAARGLWATAGSWSSAHLTDGAVPDHVLASLGGTPELADELCAAGLWRRTRRGYVFHDWLEWGSKRTAKEIHELRAVRAEAGRAGGLASGRTRKKSSAQFAKQTRSKPSFASSPDGPESGHRNTDEQEGQASKPEANAKQVASQLVDGGLNPNTSSYTHTALNGPSPPLGARDPKGNFLDVKNNSQANRLPSAIPFSELTDPARPPGHQPATGETIAAAAEQARQALNRRPE